jgi:hypothetical protein
MRFALGAQARRMVGLLCLGFRVRHPLKHAKVPLAERGFHLDREPPCCGEKIGHAARPREVTRPHGVERRLLQSFREGDGLSRPASLKSTSLWP